MTHFPENEPVPAPGPPWWIWAFAIGFAVLGVASLLLGHGEDRPWYLSGWSYFIIGALWAAQGLWMRYRSSRSQRPSVRR